MELPESLYATTVGVGARHTKLRRANIISKAGTAPLSMSIAIAISATPDTAFTAIDPKSPNIDAEQTLHRVNNPWAGASIPIFRKTPAKKVEPELKIHESARSLITSKVETALYSLLPFIEREAQRNYIPVSKVEVSGFVDPDEGDQEVVVIQWVDISQRVALDYWDKLGSAIDTWVEYLSEDLKNIVNERLAIEVRWTIDEP